MKMMYPSLAQGILHFHLVEINSGMYCYDVLRCVGITALVDSGATATLISEAVYNKLPFK